FHLKTVDFTMEWVVMPQSEDHISLDQIEMYSMGKLNDADSARIEEHLLICGPCRERLEETERYAAAMRSAARTLQNERPREPWWSLRPVWVGAFTTAAALLLFLIFRPSTPVAPF